MLIAALPLLCAAPQVPVPSPWRAWLDGPGGEIPFRLDIKFDPQLDEGDQLAVHILNGVERIVLARVEYGEGQITLHVDPYDSRITATVSEDGRALDGTWERYRGPDKWTRMPFHARAGFHSRFPARPVTDGPTPSSIDGRWSVQFASDEDPAVGVFEVDGTRASGTFLTTLGDYRYLAGQYANGRLELSCFDGAHAFLFRAELQEDGTLAGDFWSRDTWHDTWTAQRDPDAELPDPFQLNEWTGAVPLSELSYPDVNGETRSLAEDAFSGKARLLVLFGTWCPNCHDESEYLAELDSRYRKRGLKIQGLAFEFGDDRERHLAQLAHYAEHHDLHFPLLLAGRADKQEASQAFPLLDRVKSYPTTIFLDAQNEVRAIHTGFSGPATGEAHTRLRERFESLIEQLIGE